LLHPHAPDIADAYVDAYCTVAGIARDTVVGWLPVVAAGRLSEGVEGEEAAMLMTMVGSLTGRAACPSLPATLACDCSGAERP
jgi:hypothetical protein